MNVNLSGLIQRAKSLSGRDSSFFGDDLSVGGLVGGRDERSSLASSCDGWCGCSCHSANYGDYGDFAFNGFDELGEYLNDGYEDYAAEYMGEDNGYSEDYDDYMGDLADYGFSDNTEVDELVDKIVYLIEELFGDEGVYADASEEVLGNVLGDFDLASYSIDSPSDDYSTDLVDDGTLSQLESYYQQLKELEKLVGEANGEVSDLTDGEFSINERWNPNGSHDVVRNGNGRDQFDSEKFQEDYRKAHNGEDFQKKYGDISDNKFTPRLNFDPKKLSAEKQRYVDYAMKKAEEFGLNPIVIANQFYQESRFNPEAGSSAGAKGIAQVMPATAKGYINNGKYKGSYDWRNPYNSIDMGLTIMADLVGKYDGDYKLALIGYNGGPLRANQYQSGDTSKLKKETRDYVKTITGTSV